MNMKKYLKTFIILIATGLFLTSCDKMDGIYDDFLTNGEIVYNGKAEGLEAHPGISRMELKWYIISDPKIVKAKVFWTNPILLEDDINIPNPRTAGRDSVTIDIVRGTGTDSVITVIDRLKEGVYTFEVFMYDKNGHSSVGAEIIAEVYGSVYLGTISNRPLDVPKLDTIGKKSNLYIPWFGISQQAVKIDVQYTDVSGVERITHIKKVTNPVDSRRPMIWQDRDTIFNYKEGTGFKYRTAYLPEADAIDTFYTGYTNIASSAIAYYIPPPPPSKEENLALGRPVTVSSSSGAAITDGDRKGDPSPKWQPSSAERADLNVWFYVDLGSARTFNTAGLYIPKASGNIPFFEILVTSETSITSSTKWTRVYSQFTKPDAENEITFNSTTARFVKVSLNLDKESTNINVSEFELYNRP